MDFADVNSFLPAYPSTEIRDDNLFDLFPSGFYQSTYQKKEFYQLRPDPARPRINDGKFHPQDQQTYASRYASAFTLNDNQIIIHSMGLGKTGLAIITVENNLGKGGLVGAVIAASNKRFEKSFITEIIKITGTKYFPDNHEDMPKEKLAAAVKKRITKVYKFLTFDAFANSIQGAKEAGGNASQQLNQQYSNRVIVVDEAHNLRIQPEKKAESSRVNSAFHLLLHSVTNCKILLMTATPMRDRWNELPDLANLLLPLDKQLPSGDAFDKRFKNDGVSIENTHELKESLKGMISTLRTVPSSVQREYIGELVNGMSIFKLDLCQMSPHQAEGYLRAYGRDKGNEGKKEGIYGASQQAANFVFPDGSYGKEGFLRYTIPIEKAIKMVAGEMKEGIGGKKKRAPRGTRSFEVPQLTAELKGLIKGSTEEETLNNLWTYSAKYAKTVRDILNQAKEKGGNSFIYNAFVEGSGAIIFSRILELFGYKRSLNGNEKVPGKRYALLTGQSLDENGKMISNIEKAVNDPRNARGEYLQVVIGSVTAGEGLSFYNVGNIGVHTPFWNYSPTDQAIGRGLRYGSQDEIIKIFKSEGKDFSVKIHHYAAVIPDQLDECIDVILYKRSEDKDIKIKLGERFLKEISYDCGNNRIVNMRGLDGSRACEYLQCAYKCEGITEEDIKANDLDQTTFDLYYSEEEEKKIIETVKSMFRERFYISFRELRMMFVGYHEYVILKAMKQMVDKSMTIINKYGFKSFIREHNDIYFLVDTIDRVSSSLAVYYTTEPAIKKEIPFSEYADNIQFDRSEDFLSYLYDAAVAKNYEAVLGYWSRLPNTIKEELLEAVIDAQQANRVEMRDFRVWLLDILKVNIHTLKSGQIVSTLLDGVMMCRSVEGKWTDCSDDEPIRLEIEEKKVEEEKSLEDNPWGYYGIINEELLRGADGWKHGFWIKDMSRAKAQGNTTDARLKIKGEKCSIGTLKMGKLASIAYRFGLDNPNGVDKAKKIEDIRKIIAKDQYFIIDSSEFSEPEIRRLYRLYKAGAKTLCTSLLNWFRENKLFRTTDEENMKTKK